MCFFGHTLADAKQIGPDTNSPTRAIAGGQPAACQGGGFFSNSLIGGSGRGGGSSSNAMSLGLGLSGSLFPVTSGSGDTGTTASSSSALTYSTGTAALLEGVLSGQLGGSISIFAAPVSVPVV